ncbi:hypothetical protein [Streptomyces eurythermus]
MQDINDTLALLVDTESWWRQPDGTLKQFPQRQGSDLEQAYPVVVVGFRVGHEAGMGTGLEVLATEAGLELFRDRRLYHSSGDVSEFIGETITFVGAAGGLAGIAAVLKAFFDRHNGKR